MVSLFLCAMTPLKESDLSNISNPLSLSINPEQRIKINNKPNAWDDSDGLNQLLPTSSGLMLHFDINLFGDIDETAERYASNKPFSSFTLLWSNNDVFHKVQIFLIDPVTGKNYTTLFSDDDIFNKYQIFPINSITWKNYTTIINAETVNAEDTNEPNSNTQATGTPSITHSNIDTSSSNSPYRYNIMSGNADMRDTYINKTNTTIQSGSWVDIKTR
jgi:hypothetical protein